MKRNDAPPTRSHVIDTADPAAATALAEAYMQTVRARGDMVLAIKPRYGIGPDARRLCGYVITHTGDAPAPAPEEPAPAPAPAVEVTPLGLAYLLPGIEPRPRLVAPGVAQSSLF